MVKVDSDQAWHPNIWLGGWEWKWRKSWRTWRPDGVSSYCSPNLLLLSKRTKQRMEAIIQIIQRKKSVLYFVGYQDKDYQSELSQRQSLKKFTSQVCSATLWVINLYNHSWRSDKALNNLEFTRLPNNISPLGEISEEIGDIMTQ